MSEEIIFISFYTAGGLYPELAGKLKKSLNKFNLKSHIVKINKNFKTWVEGTHFKPNFILQSLLKFKKTVVWMDIDTEVWKFPELLFGKHDFAIYNWIADKDHHLFGKIPYDPKTKFLMCAGGVQKYSYTNASIHLLKNWIYTLKENNNRNKRGDPCLDIAFNHGTLGLRTLWLPKTYNRMDKHSSFWANMPIDSVVINHDYVAGKHGETSSKKNKGF